MSFAGKWMKLEIIMFSKISHIQKDKYRMFSLVGGMQKKEKRQQENRKKISKNKGGEIDNRMMSGLK